MKLLSWNVNGIRSVLGKGFLNFVKQERPDVLCLQETRSLPLTLDLELSHYHAYWNSPERKGYSGTAVFTQTKPLRVTNGMEIPEHDAEGRIVTAEFPDFFLVNVYTPNSKRDLSRLPYCQEWDAAFLSYLKKLEKSKPVVFCGDLNVAHKEIDLTNPASNRRNHGFTDEERLGFTNFVKSGFLDTFREFVPDGGYYTWWSQMNRCRERNIGWRIDYFLISAPLKPRLQEAFILPHVTGSDHCPVGIEIK